MRRGRIAQKEKEDKTSGRIVHRKHYQGKLVQ